MKLLIAVLALVALAGCTWVVLQAWLVSWLAGPMNLAQMRRIRDRLIQQDKEARP